MSKSLSKILIVIFFSFSVVAQQKRKSFKEEFVVDANVFINIDTRHADVEVETWKKNKVVVEAFMMVAGENITNKVRDNFYKNWDFRAYGNKKSIRITSKSKHRININTFNFDSPDYSHFFNNNDFKITIPDISIINLDILDSIDLKEPLPPIPPENPRIIRLNRCSNTPSQFDFKAYKRDKNYLEKWKKENEDIIGKDVEIKICKNAISIKSEDKTSNYCWKFCTEDSENANQISERIKLAMKKREEEREKYYKERVKRLKLRRKAIEKYHKERVKRLKLRKKTIEKRNKNLVKRIEEIQERRKEIQHALKSRCNLKIKRVIKIKAPKDAKFKMNIKYGTVSFPKK